MIHSFFICTAPSRYSSVILSVKYVFGKGGALPNVHTYETALKIIVFDMADVIVIAVSGLLHCYI